MNKKLILAELIKSTINELHQLELACESAKSYNQSDDMKQEGKYDTRAIESGYLVGAQLKRVEELKRELKLLQDTNTEPFEPGTPIAIGALIELKLNSNSQIYFLCPTAGGTLLKIDDRAVLVISAFSPLGDELIGLMAGDSFELETPKEVKEYQIISVG